VSPVRVHRGKKKDPTKEVKMARYLAASRNLWRRTRFASSAQFCVLSGKDE
jgi:hypothetical protein